VKYGPIDYQAISYYAAPKKLPKLDSLDQVDPEAGRDLREARQFPLRAKGLSGVAVDAVSTASRSPRRFQAELASTA